MQTCFPKGNGFKDGRRLGRLVRGHFTLLSLNRLADIANKTLFACCRSTAAKVLRQTHFKANFIPLAVSDWLPSNLHFTRANLKVSVYPLVRFFFFWYFSHHRFIGYGCLINQCVPIYNTCFNYLSIIVEFLHRFWAESQASHSFFLQDTPFPPLSFN